MLEQAIIDADALKEAAVKNAETLVLEKFSNQIKSAVETLLEQDMPGMPDLSDMPGAGADLSAGLGLEGEEDAEAAEQPESSVMEHIPNAATTRKDEMVQIPLDALMEEIRLMGQELQFNGDSVVGESLLGEDPPPAPGPGTPGATPAETDCPDGFWWDPDQGETGECVPEEHVEPEPPGAGMEEDLSLDEDILASIAEQLVVDHKPQKSGWAGTSESIMELSEEELLALEQDSERLEKREAIRKAVAALENVNEAVVKQNTRLQGSVKESTDQINKLMHAVRYLSEKLESTNLSNAKLLYQNKALESDSLNERQKHKLAEAISKADNIDEAKVIFETLQSTVGSTSHKKQPKSLSEAVETSSSVILASRKRNPDRQKKAPAEFDRWKFLAGIK